MYPQAATESETLLAVGDLDYGSIPKGAENAYVKLPESRRELKRVIEAFGGNNSQGLSGSEATAKEIMARLSKVQYAHFATHGYFDALHLTEERKREQEQLKLNLLGQDHHRGGAAKNPLGFVGLALTGANDPKANGIFTGLNIVDLPLEKLRLCV